MTGLIATCMLLLTPVSGDCRAAQRYEAVYRKIPAEHRALVVGIVITDWSHARVEDDRIVLLPERGSPGNLTHEVGHLVSWQNDRQPLTAWTGRFWKGGELRGTSASGYGLTTPGEDFAESYRRHIEGTLREASGQRAAWMRRHVLLSR